MGTSELEEEDDPLFMKSIVNLDSTTFRGNGGARKRDCRHQNYNESELSSDEEDVPAKKKFGSYFANGGTFGYLPLESPGGEPSMNFATLDPVQFDEDKDSSSSGRLIKNSDGVHLMPHVSTTNIGGPPPPASVHHLPPAKTAGRPFQHPPSLMNFGGPPHLGTPSLASVCHPPLGTTSTSSNGPERTVSTSSRGSSSVVPKKSNISSTPSSIRVNPEVERKALVSLLQTYSSEDSSIPPLPDLQEMELGKISNKIL
jgi:hypothetical protein